ncbi:hypothetical protein GCM10007304_18020 [Rhodococcoides trifolii]|uniref:Helix-turn-helix DNA binding domain protein n=1 Tax=Rhodococcoides trifolii TaxID=908250 RepID=A0A917CZ18_9NOCA|nr:hypothetical protein [Rhodococcus trifolii]GGG04290.1 hypothetical protein GCM10007304_18020 [Rhodococcus trifolii]
MTNTTSPNRLSDREKALEALRMRRDSSAQWQEIADALGYSSMQAAQRAVARLANRIETKDVDSYRAKLDEQLAWLWDQVEDRIVNGDRNAMGFAQTVQAGRAIIDRRAKLHGVDAAVKVEASVVVSSQFDAEIQAMADAIAAKAGGEPVLPEPAGVDLVKHEVQA